MVLKLKASYSVSKPLNASHAVILFLSSELKGCVFTVFKN